MFKEDLATIATQEGISIEAIAIAHGTPDPDDEDALEIYDDSLSHPLSEPIEGILALSLHKADSIAFIEELFISGNSRGSGLGPHLIHTIFIRLPEVVEVHLATNRDGTPTSPETCY